MADIKQISIGDTVYDIKDANALPNTTKYGADLSYSNSQLQLKDQDGNALGNAVTIESSPAIDNTTITTNSSDQLQASSLVGLTSTVSELNYCDGVTSNIQTQIDNKATDSTVVHLAGAETVSGTKTFNYSALTSANLIINSGTSGTTSAIRFNVNGTTKGYLGINPNGVPCHSVNGSTINNSIVRSTWNTATGSDAQPVYINASGVATACTNYNALQPLRYSKYSISTYSSTNPYIKLATFTATNTNNYDFSYMFWVEILRASTVKSYALCRLTARWGSSTFAGTKFEILERYGDYSSSLDTLTFAYNYTSVSSKGNLTGEIWISSLAVSYVSYYLRPADCNEYGDYSLIPVTYSKNPWTYYVKAGTSAQIASTEITSGYTQVAITDNSGIKKATYDSTNERITWA